jgi:Ca2+-binding EF-hand superfamily protein
MILLSNIHSENVQRWNEAFEALDTEHTGKIKIGDIVDKFNEMGIRIKKRSKLRKLYQKDRNITINYSDFLAHIVNMVRIKLIENFLSR